jgi:hypothetical protein
MNEANVIYEKAMAEVMPYENWERLPRESAAAYAGFCIFRDYGAERSIKRVVEQAGLDEREEAKRYRLYRQWSMTFKWFKRASDYDLYLDRIKQAERRKTIEGREAAYRNVTAKMLGVVEKKLDLMSPGALEQSEVVSWMKAAVGTERAVLGVSEGKQGDNGGQLQLNFDGEFEGL